MYPALKSFTTVVLIVHTSPNREFVHLDATSAGKLHQRRIGQIRLAVPVVNVSEAELVLRQIQITV